MMDHANLGLHTRRAILTRDKPGAHEWAARVGCTSAAYMHAKMRRAGRDEVHACENHVSFAPSVRSTMYLAERAYAINREVTGVQTAMFIMDEWGGLAIKWTSCLR